MTQPRVATRPGDLIVTATVDGESWACSARVRLGADNAAVVELLYGYERGAEGTPVADADVPEEAQEELTRAAVAEFYAKAGELDTAEERRGDYLRDQQKDEVR